jgi:aryl-alcohol dehydrogenase-like predicted oxidoreductase
MDERRFGRTNHWSAVAILGAFAFSKTSQFETDRVMEGIITAGVNHIDVAPTYGDAELRLAPWLAKERERFFLGCKTMERTASGARESLERSLERLQVEYFDLYQIHAVTTMEELDAATAMGGALQAIIEAREAGLTKYIGITGHGVDSPALFLEALSRFDFDSVLFPVNFIQYANPAYRQVANQLLEECRQKDVGVMAIKSIARGPWGESPQTYNTWYRPFDDPGIIQEAVNFSLSQDITGICTTGDPYLLPLLLEACENYISLTQAEQEEMIAKAVAYDPLFV